MSEEETTQADNQQHVSDEGAGAKDGDVVQGDKNVVEAPAPEGGEDSDE